MKRQSILISRDARTESLLKSFCLENGLTLLEQSFIITRAIDGVEIPATDWVFFTSPRGGKLFVDTYGDQLSSDIKYAALGKATADQLEQFGMTMSFVGDPDDPTSTIGQKLKETIGNESILFPVSQISKLKVSNEIPEDQTHVINTYVTLPSGKKVDDYDIIVVTSPSNFEGYLVDNDVPENTVLITYGETTTAAIQAMNLANDIIDISSTDQNKLIEKISELI